MFIAEEVSSYLDSIIEKSFLTYEQELGERILLVNRNRYSGHLRNFFEFLLSNVEESDNIDNNIESLDRKIYDIYIFLDTNESFLNGIFPILIQDISDYLTRILAPINFITRYKLLGDYSLSIAQDIKNFNYSLSESAREFLEVVNPYKIYTQGEINSNHNSLIKFTKYINYHEKSDILRGKFKDRLEENTSQVIAQFSQKIEDISYFISDTEDYTPNELKKTIYDVPIPVLKKSWGGEGLDLYTNLLKIYNSSLRLGRAEFSMSGDLELINDFLHVYLSATYCEMTEYKFYYLLPNKSFFGDFTNIFFFNDRQRENNQLKGVGFLRRFNLLKSFNPASPGDKVYDRYINGVGYLKKNSNVLRQEAETQRSLIGIQNQKNSFLLKVLNEITRVLLSIGDTSASLDNSLNERGLLRGYEGLGSIKYILKLLKKVFPAFNDRIVTKNFIGYEGLLGAMSNFSSTMSLLMEKYNVDIFNTDLGDKIIQYILENRNHLENIITTIEKNGYKVGQFIPNLDLSPSPQTKDDIADYLTKKGYATYEVEKILSLNSPREVLEKFSSKIDSGDIKSFIKGYDLLQGMYIIGGEASIYEFMEFISTEGENEVKIIFDQLLKNQDAYLKFDSFKYGELIGTLLNIYGRSKANLKNLLKYIRTKDENLSNILDVLSTPSSIRDRNLGLNLNRDYVSLLLANNKKGIYQNRIDLECKDFLKSDSLGLRKLVKLIDSSMGFANEDDLKGLLNNNIGLRGVDLYEVLNIRDNPGFSLLGGILSGLRGGDYSYLIRNVYLSGLCYLLTPNLVQTKARKSPQKITYESLTTLNSLHAQLKRLDILFKIFVENVNFSKINLNQKSDTYINEFKNVNFSPVINAVNKPLGVFEKVFSYLVPDSKSLTRFQKNYSLLVDTVSASPPQEPPGIGNNPYILKSLNDSISPEIGYLLTTKNNRFLNADTVEYMSSYDDSEYKLNLPIEGINFVQSPGEFIKFPEEVLNIRSIGEETQFIRDARDDFYTTADDALTQRTYTHALKDKNSSLIQNKFSQIGKSTFNVENISIGADTPNYDPVMACARMGTKKEICEKTYKAYNDNNCGDKYLSHSPIIDVFKNEPINHNNNSNNDTLVITRPIGFLGSIEAPQSVFNSYKKPPRYWEEINYNSKIHNKNGEPLFTTMPLLTAFNNYEITDTDFYQMIALKAQGNKLHPTDCDVENNFIKTIGALNAIKKRINPAIKSENSTVYLPHNSSVPLPIKNFNYALIENVGKYNFDTFLEKSYLKINLNTGNLIELFKLTNTGIISWNDNWLGDNNLPARRDIKQYDFSSSSNLRTINITHTNEKLKKITANNCPVLEYVNISKCQDLEYLSLDDCINLRSIRFGLNSTIRHLSLRNCSLSPVNLEDILRSFSPIFSGELTNRGNNIEFKSILDLRGNSIDWANRNIASKIRLLLANNFSVLWDGNKPPTNIIPLQYYSTLEVSNSPLKVRLG